MDIKKQKQKTKLTLLGNAVPRVFEHDCRPECECALITKTVSDITLIACLLWDLKAVLVFPSEDGFFFFFKCACEKCVRCQQIKILPGNTEGNVVHIALCYHQTIIQYLPALLVICSSL